MARRKSVTDIGDEDFESGKWHLNRGIPVVWIIGSLAIGIMQIGVFIWYASQFSARVEIVEKTQVSSTALVDNLRTALTAQNVETAKLGEKVVAVQATANRIEALLTVQNRPR